jgi:hypothetical protein
MSTIFNPLYWERRNAALRLYASLKASQCLSVARYNAGYKNKKDIEKTEVEFDRLCRQWHKMIDSAKNQPL